MSKQLKVSWDEVTNLIESTYGGKVTFMTSPKYEPDYETIGTPDYILIDLPDEPTEAKGEA